MLRELEVENKQLRAQLEKLTAEKQETEQKQETEEQKIADLQRQISKLKESVGGDA